MGCIVVCEEGEGIIGGKGWSLYTASLLALSPCFSWSVVVGGSKTRFVHDRREPSSKGHGVSGTSYRRELLDPSRTGVDVIHDYHSWWVDAIGRRCCELQAAGPRVRCEDVSALGD